MSRTTPRSEPGLMGGVRKLRSGRLKASATFATYLWWNSGQPLRWHQQWRSVSAQRPPRAIFRKRPKERLSDPFVGLTVNSLYALPACLGSASFKSPLQPYNAHASDRQIRNLRECRQSFLTQAATYASAQCCKRGSWSQIGPCFIKKVVNEFLINRSRLYNLAGPTIASRFCSLVKRGVRN